MNIIERVARAIHDAMYSDEQSGAWMSGKCPLDSVTVDGEVDLIRAATTAIQAMRDPTPEMIEAGEAVDGTVTALPIWQAMIDASLIDTCEMEPIDTSFGVGEG